jgi:phosphatidylserine/phosphatidylglycerophosphate/cardiolipin synthase-like enzyme
MIFPFNYDDVFKTVYDEDKDYLRMLIFEKTAEAKKAKSKADSDVDLLVTGGAALESQVERFVKEVTPKSTVDGGILYVHNKFIIVDPLGDDPAVLTGSANFSRPSITSNDENSMLIKGDARVADIYLTEFNRLFDHFWPRYLRKITPKKQGDKKGFEKPLDEQYEWFVDYHKKASFHFKRGQLFKKMKGAKQG